MALDRQMDYAALNEVYEVKFLDYEVHELVVDDKEESAGGEVSRIVLDNVVIEYIHIGCL